MKEERQMRILEKLRAEGKILATGLSEALGVSEDTIRRDLRDLAEAGKLQRVHGGALPKSSLVGNHDVREGKASAEKVSVARAAVGLLKNGQVVIMDGGTTVQEVVRSLPEELRVTVVTHSPTTAVALARYPYIEVIVIGGTLSSSNVLTVGAETVEAYASINADLCLQGIWSIHAEVGVSHPHFEEARVKRAMTASADRTIGLATSDKLGTASTFTVGPVEELAQLVVERTAPEEALAPFRERGLEIVTG